MSDFLGFPEKEFTPQSSVIEGLGSPLLLLIKALKNVDMQIVK